MSYLALPVSGIISVAVVLIASDVLGETGRRQLAEKHGIVYVRILIGLAALLCLQAALLFGIPLYSRVLSSPVTSSGFLVLDLILYSPSLLMGLVLWRMSWWLLKEAQRTEMLPGSGICRLLACGRPALVTAVPIALVASAAWYVPLLVWRFQGRPPIEQDRNLINPAAESGGSHGIREDSVWLINGKPGTLRCDQIEGKSAIGDVIVSVEPAGSRITHTHTFKKVSANPYGYWGVRLAGRSVVRVRAQLTSGPFSAVYNVTAPNNGIVTLALEFFGPEPRVLLYPRDGQDIQLVRPSS